MEEGYPSLPRSHLAGLFIISFVYMRGRLARLGEISVEYPRSRLDGLEIFHVNTIKGASSPRRAGNQRYTHVHVFQLSKLSWPSSRKQPLS